MFKKGLKKNEDKKIFIIVVLVLTVFTIAACSRKGAGSLERSYDLTNNIPKGFVENNAFVTPDPLNDYGSATKLTGFDGFDSYYSEFLITYVYIDDEYKYGLLSLFDNVNVLENVYKSIQGGIASHYNKDTQRYFTINFFKVIDKNDRVGIYSANEQKWIVALDFYEILEYNTTFSNLNSIEVITKKAEDEVVTVTRNKIVFNTERTFIREEIPFNAVGEDVFNTVEYTTLNDSRVADYKFRIRNNVLYGYKNDKELYKINLDKDVTSIRGYVGKYFIIQTRTALPFDAKEYSYYFGGEKFLLKTITIDLTNGKVNEAKAFNYLLTSSINQRKESNNKYSTFIANARKIVDKTLLNEEQVLFSEGLKYLANLSVLNFTFDNYKIADDRFLAGNKIVNSKYEMVVDLFNYNNTRFLQNVNLISLSYNGLYGLIDLDGKIVVPFHFERQFEFINGRSYNIEADTDKEVLISPAGAIRKLTDTESMEVSGLIIDETTEGLTVKNYNNESLISLVGNYSISNIYSFLGGNFEFERGYIVAIINDDNSEISYYVVKA